MPQRGRTSKSAGAGSAAKDKTKAATRSRTKPNTRAAGKAGAKGHAKDRIANAMSDEDARAALESSDKLYYRIGEVSELTAVKAHVLRYWETEHDEIFEAYLKSIDIDNDASSDGV